MPTYTTKESALIETAVQILQNQAFLKEDETGYYVQSHLEVVEQLSQESLRVILSTPNKWEAFYKETRLWEKTNRQKYHHSLSNTLKMYWNAWAYEKLSKTDELFLVHWVTNHVRVAFPYETLLAQTVRTNITLQAMNETNKTNNVLWFAEQQGYTKQDMISVREKETENKFLTTISQAMEHMQSITFFVSMSLQDLMHLHEKDAITLAKDVSAGILETWSETGTRQSISLEQNITIPLPLADVQIDGAKGFSVQQLSSVFNSFWSNTALTFH